MQPVRLTIPGEFWDTQIYQGRLYLFTREGSIQAINWDRAIDDWAIHESLKLALECAFRASDYLYGWRFRRLFEDSDLKQLLEDKFEKLASAELTLSAEQLEALTIGTQDSPFPFPHADSTIYKRKLYVGSRSGVYRTTCNKRTRYPISTRVEKIWDCPVLSVSASYDSLAAAAGDEGLYELPIEGYLPVLSRRRPTPLSASNCVSCNWTFASIYGSSHLASGVLAAYKKELRLRQVEARKAEVLAELETPEGDVLWAEAEPEVREFQRTFDRLIPDEKIFGGRGYSWGVQDKLYQAQNGRLRVVRYQPWESARTGVFADLGSIDIQPARGDVVAGGVGVFGTVIEYDTALIVMSSDGSVVTLPGEPVNWRVFPRSRHYENQLHVIYDDRLEVLSFNQDYFVDQATKRSGTTQWREDGGRFGAKR